MKLQIVEKINTFYRLVNSNELNSTFLEVIFIFKCDNIYYFNITFTQFPISYQSDHLVTCTANIAPP